MTVSRPLLLGLIASATLNVFLVGCIAGAMWARKAELPVAQVTERQGARPGRAPLWSAGQALSPDSRRGLRRALREANQTNRPILEAARDERRAAIEALRAEPYDTGAVQQRFTAARARDGEARANVEAALAAYAASLSAEERAALADGLTRVYGPRARIADGR